LIARTLLAVSHHTLLLGPDCTGLPRYPDDKFLTTIRNHTTTFTNTAVHYIRFPIHEKHSLFAVDIDTTGANELAADESTLSAPIVAVDVSDTTHISPST
jgi:hypothetical protein